jgi:hypothetical protein
MTDTHLKLATLLKRFAGEAREAGLPGDVAARLEQLAGQVNEPCVVAVVGRVKAGKSTFLNALLGEDLAKVGTTETTATINYFRHGTPDPERPVRCYWRGGQATDESRVFLDSLQGNDLDTLRRAEAIHHLEYHLLNPYLERVVLVDTPGLSAVVDAHQDRTAEFLALQGQLRDRQDRDTQRLGSEADAVIYLTGAVARATDQGFLDEFGHVTQGRSRAFNAVGVLAKIDLQPHVLARRRELAAKIASQLKGGLNTVVPVSAGLRRALDGLLQDGGSGLARLVDALRRIPPARLEKFLDSEELYRASEAKDCPVTPAEREALLGNLDWAVFTTIARVAADPALTPPDVADRLSEIAGFDRLKEVLERHLFKRGRLLRWYRIVNDARQVLGQVRYQHLRQFRQHDREERAREQRFVAFIRQAQGDPTVARELEAFITGHGGGTQRAGRVEASLNEWDRQLAEVFHDLEEYNADFEALQQLEDHVGSFSAAEQGELRALFGLYGVETDRRLPPDSLRVDHVERRQQAWSQVALSDRSPVRCQVAQRAVSCYGLILNELTGANRGP